tara:strand:+ start:247 stop:618 length:372 start_codon:yes stop_codon:yes gene_type:complete
MNLSPKQEQAASMLARGHTITDIAKMLEVNRVTVHRWTKIQDFQDYLEDQKVKEKTLRLATTQTTPEELVQALIKDAHSCLSEILRSGQNEKARVDAAKYILERYEEITEQSSSLSLQDWLNA